MKYNYFYKIINNINGKFYYGVHKTNNINDRYMGSGVTLKPAKKKYGLKNFSKEILFFFKTYKECLEYEALIVDKDMVINPMCYNVTTGGVGGGDHSNYKHSEQTKENIRLGHKNRSIEDKEKTSAYLSEVLSNKSQDTLKKMSESRMGWIYTQEVKNKISDTLKGRKLPKEVCEKMSASRTGDKNPMSGLSLYDNWVNKFGKDIADKKFTVWKENLKKARNANNKS